MSEEQGAGHADIPEGRSVKVELGPSRNFWLALLIVVCVLLVSLGLRFRAFELRYSTRDSPLEEIAVAVASIVAGLVMVYVLIGRVFKMAKGRRPALEADLIMIQGLIRGLLAIVGVFAVLVEVFEMGTVFAVVGAFSGMFLGWSLRQPVSGLVAWIMVTLKRPFRVGDRVFFPNIGIKGDVLDVGVMYTSLNQVGGTVGGEDRTNREVLLPNASLWSNVAINYTSQSGDDSELPGGYILDEVVTRITYDSDIGEAERIVVEAARAETAQIIEEIGVEPYARADLYDYGIMMRVRYITFAVGRARISHGIVKRIVASLKDSGKVDLAIPWVYSYGKAMGHK